MHNAEGVLFTLLLVVSIKPEKRGKGIKMIKNSQHDGETGHLFDSTRSGLLNLKTLWPVVNLLATSFDEWSNVETLDKKFNRQLTSVLSNPVQMA